MEGVSTHLLSPLKVACGVKLRVKDNNEPLEEISSFYIFIKEDNKWKIKFSSAFFFPK